MSASCSPVHASAISRSVTTGGSRASAGGLGTRMHPRWTPCCSAQPQPCGSGLCSLSTARQKLLAHATMPCFRGQCLMQAVLSSILSGLCRCTPYNIQFQNFGWQVCNVVTQTAAHNGLTQYLQPMSSMLVQVYWGPDKGWRGRHAAANRDACT